MLVLLLFLLLIAPVRLTLTLDGPLTIDLRIWGLGRSWQPDLSPGQADPSRQQLMRMVGAVLRADKARRFLRQHITLVSLQVMLHLGLADAAQTALLTGLLRQVASLLPENTDIRIQPDFLRTTRLQARCILFFHLGTIVITAGMVLLAWLLERREHPAPKEA